MSSNPSFKIENVSFLSGLAIIAAQKKMRGAKSLILSGFFTAKNTKI